MSEPNGGEPAPAEPPEADPPATSPPATSPPATSPPATSPPPTSQPPASQPATSQPPTGQHQSGKAGTSPLRDVLVVYGIVFVGTALLGSIRTATLLDDVAQVGIALLFLGLPLRLARREEGGAKRYGIALGGLLEPEEEDRGPAGPLGLYELARTVKKALPSGLRELGVALGLGAVVFPPFVVGFWLWHEPAGGFQFRLPPDFWSFVIAQFVLVGLPEEAFFRGFAQTRLTDWAKERGGIWAPRRVLGATLSVPALVLSATLFALVHLASEPRLDELATFFPGLVFGWLRAKRGGIGAALSFHALSNILAEILVRGWLA